MIISTGTIKIVWYADRIGLLDAFRIKEFHQFLGKAKGAFLYKREEHYTKLVDMRELAEDCMDCFGKNGRAKIKRAIREGVRVEVETDLDRCIDYYNQFAASKGRSPIARRHLERYDSLIITKAVVDGVDEPLAMHINIHDDFRVRLLMSCSHFRDRPELRNLVGFANRYLHWQDFVRFRGMGLSVYDLGGYGLGATDADTQNLNRFKDEFRGEVRREDNFIPYTMIAMKTVKHMIERLVRRRGAPTSSAAEPQAVSSGHRA